jgi:7-keto-8-aminopelargonate synthetase-like enzyme
MSKSARLLLGSAALAVAYGMAAAAWSNLVHSTPEDDQVMGIAKFFAGTFSALHSQKLVNAVVVIAVLAVLYSTNLKRLFSPKKGTGKKSQGKSGGGAHEKIQMTRWVTFKAYWGYFILFLMGIVRECVMRLRALIVRDEFSKRYVNRTRWVTGMDDFYISHMYGLYVDIFSRPIVSAPDASVDVVKRTRPGGWLFSPFHRFTHLDEVHKCINLASYNYLGFGGVDEFVTPVTRSAVSEHGFSTAATRTEGGTLPIHRELEHEVAKFLGKEDAMVLGMGFATNATVLPALFDAKPGGSGVLVLSDALNHRSIVEGVRLSGATVRAFVHNSMEDLEAKLKRAVEEGQPNGQPWKKIVVVVEGIYSMEGDFCRLREIVSLKNAYKAYLYLDEAHSIGAVGASGRGVTELLGVPTAEVDIMMGTFTKSFGSTGGYVAASKAVIDALRWNAPGSIFATAMSPPSAAQALAALQLISGAKGGDTGAKKLTSIRENSNHFRKRLMEAGFKLLGDVDSPIIPVMFHHATHCTNFSRECLENGIAVVSVGSPAVPLLYERVRFCISAAHTKEQLDWAVSKMAEIGGRRGALFDKNLAPSEKAAKAAQDEEYARWLRQAPLVSRGQKDAPCVANWSPEPLAAASPPHAGIASAALQSSITADAHTSLDVRMCDPLGYTVKPSVSAQQAAQDAMDIYGFGACGPRGFYGTSKPHLEFEAALARHLGVEASILYSAGVATASSVLPALLHPGDHVIIDVEAHLGLRTGLRLTRAEVSWVQQHDLNAIKEALSGKAAKRCEKKRGRTFIVVEGLCQRTGRIAPLEEFIALKEKFGALLLLDDSFAFGALGAHGRGSCEHFNVDAKRVDIIIGSLEHAISGVGGFCAGDRCMIEHQRLAGAGYCFSASSPPCSASFATEMLADLERDESTERRARLSSNSFRLHETLSGAIKQSGAPVELVSSPDSYIKHLRWSSSVVDCETQLLSVAEACSRDAGVRVQVCSPSLCIAEQAYGARIGAQQSSRPSLRLNISECHSSEDIVAIGSALQAALSALNVDEESVCKSTAAGA